MSSAIPSASTIPIRIVLFFTAAAIFSGVGLAIWNQYSSSSYDSKQDAKSNTIMMQQQQDYTTLSSQIVILNSTIYAQVGELNVKIMLVNTTIYGQLDYIYSNLTNIYDILNVSSGNASSFVQYVNSSLFIITGDINNLQMNVSNLYSNVTVLQGSITEIFNNLTQVWNQLDNLEATKLETINGVTGDATNKNINLVSVNTNTLTITPSPGNNTVYLNVPESLMKFITENGTVVPDGFGQIYITGGPDGLIDVNYTGPNTLVVCATGVQTALNNQDMMIMQLTAQVVAQNTTINNLDARVTMLETAIMQILQLNISGNLNTSIAALVYNVTVLQAEVVNLQNQINSTTANTSSVPVGTIVPFGGATFGNSSLVPTGYLACDGSVYPISSYTTLWTVIGTAFCGGLCNMSQFRVPDMRGQVPVGQNSGMGSFTTRGMNYGSQTHTLNSAEGSLPAHTHGVSITSAGATNGGGQAFNAIQLTGTEFSGPPNNNFFNCQRPQWTNCGGTCDSARNPPTSPQAIMTCSSDIPTPAFPNGLTENPHFHPVSGNTALNTAQNSNTPFNIIQPSLTVNYIIKY